DHRAGIVRTDSNEPSLSSSIVSSSLSSPRDRYPALWSVSCSPTAISLSRRVPLVGEFLALWMLVFYPLLWRVLSWLRGRQFVTSVRLSTMRQVLAPLLLGSPPTSSST